MNEKVNNIYFDQPLAGLKRLASFGAPGGGGIGARFFPTGANLVQGWVWAFFCASAHGKKKMMLENNFFGGKLFNDLGRQKIYCFGLKTGWNPTFAVCRLDGGRNYVLNGHWNCFLTLDILRP